MFKLERRMQASIVSYQRRARPPNEATAVRNSKLGNLRCFAIRENLMQKEIFVSERKIKRGLCTEMRFFSALIALG